VHAATGMQNIPQRIQHEAEQCVEGEKWNESQVEQGPVSIHTYMHFLEVQTYIHTFMHTQDDNNPSIDN
jgi:hypothetical protein